jgi:adenine-specific DNA-methyltransferase
MIYIDPPYNTGNDFIYSDNFTESVSDYYERTGQSAGGVKLTSNPESNGRYHSDWLTMMYPRLFLGKNLLREDGVIFVSIDDNEVHDLRLIMDEIFGEENLYGQFVWKRRTGAMDAVDNVSKDHEYILCYGRNKNQLKGSKRSFNKYTNPDNDDRGPWISDNLSAAKAGGNTYYPIKDEKTGFEYFPPKGRYWPYGPEKMKEKIKEGRIIFPGKKEGTPMLKRFQSEAKSLFTPISTWLSNVDINSQGTKEIKTIFDEKIFSHPKPLTLIKTVLEQTTADFDTILDFFAGSGTTAHAVMDLNAEDGGNRRWISVQLPELTDDASEAKKAGFNTIADISRERIRRAGEKIGKGDIGFKAFTLSPSSYRRWHEIPAEDTNALTAQTNLFNQKPLVDGYHEQSVVYELLVKEGFDLNAKVTQKQLGGLAVWHVTDGERRMVVSFAPTLRKEQIDALELGEHDVFVCFDSALDDTTKVNVGRSLKIKVM